MEKQTLYIDGIPAVLWGAASKHLFIAVHRDSSHKEDDVIRIFAEKAVGRGYQFSVLICLSMEFAKQKIGFARYRTASMI